MSSIVIKLQSALFTFKQPLVRACLNVMLLAGWLVLAILIGPQIIKCEFYDRIVTKISKD